MESIAAEEEAGPPSGYYDRWLSAMERLLLQRGLVTPEELERRTGWPYSVSNPGLRKPGDRS